MWQVSAAAVTRGCPSREYAQPPWCNSRAVTRLSESRSSTRAVYAGQRCSGGAAVRAEQRELCCGGERLTESNRRGGSLTWCGFVWLELLIIAVLVTHLGAHPLVCVTLELSSGSTGAIGWYVAHHEIG